MTDANDALAFQLVRYNDKEEAPFAPEMTHQVYGEQENVFGYRGLAISLQMTAGSLRAKLGFDSEGSLPEGDGVKPDPVLEPLLELLADGQAAKNDAEWREAVDKDKEFRPAGEKVKKEHSIREPRITFEWVPGPDALAV